MRSLLFALLISTNVSCTVSTRVRCTQGGHECDLFMATCGADNFCQPLSGADGSIDLGDAGGGCVAAVNCTTNPQQPVCLANGECGACTMAADGDAQCATHPGLHFCGAGGTCVECRASPDCASSPNGPVCENNQCRKCIASLECPSSVCILSGANAGMCADPATVAWVDNGPAGCLSGDGSSPSQAACAIDKAMLLKRPYVHVAGSATPYAAVVSLQAVTGNVGPVQISGPGIKATPSARILTPGMDGVAITANNFAATVALEGLEIGGTPGGAKGLYGVNVSTMNSGTVNVTITGCAIHDNGSGGITLNGSATYTIVNTIVAANGIGTNAGVFLANSTSGTFAFNTVAANSSSGTVGGIDCNSNTKTIQDSIVVGNMGQQLGTACSASTGFIASTINATTIVFAGASDWHLVPNNPTNAACCINKVASDPMTPFKSVDVDGTSRPKGGAWDYGAHEVQ